MKCTTPIKAWALGSTRGLALLTLGLCWLGWVVSPARAANVPAGFTEVAVPGPAAGNWTEAVGLTFEDNGRLWVWERGGRVWIKDPNDAGFSLMIDIREEVGNWGDHGFLGFAVDPRFRVNGYIYLFYTVDRYHLLNFGTPSYNPNQNQYESATIGRLTRYTCQASNGFRTVDPASRVILIGETRQTGVPICAEAHAVGSLVFGQDGTLLVGCGDGASAWAVDSGGNQTMSYAPQALNNGIIRPKEDIGAYRAQLIDCLNGKVLRIDPATGEGVSSNPFYDAADPRAPRSRVWALGLRNPFRMSLRPGSGSHSPADARPGVLYVGDVGWNSSESLFVVTGPGQNFGWPYYEGFDFSSGTYDLNLPNVDAPNPLYPASSCSPYFTFRDLLKEDTLAAGGQPPFVNPCSSGQRIPSSIPQFLHRRPVLAWEHGNTITRTPTYGGAGQAQTANVGANGSPVSGTPFAGTCAVGGAWYTSSAFPPQYQNRYYFADWEQGIIRSLTFDQNDQPLALGTFLSNAGAVVSLAPHPFDGSLYYVSYSYGDAGTVRRLSYTGNRSPVAVASADVLYGASPLSVQFNSNGSMDPDGQTIAYQWEFGDGSATSNLPSPEHTFTAPPGVPTAFTVTLTVTDGLGGLARTNLIVSANNTPPQVTVISPAEGTLYSMVAPTTFHLSASVADAESSSGQLAYEWQLLLHHNEHDHVVATETTPEPSVVVSPIGCDGINIYYYRVVLTVTDPVGLKATREVTLHPNCNAFNTAPSISDIPNQTIGQGYSTGPIDFTVGDGETTALNLRVQASSSNLALVPNSAILFGGSRSNRTLTITPAVGLSGSAVITVTVSDGPLSASDEFLLTVIPTTVLTVSFTNAAGIDLLSIGAGVPYPSTIQVSGLSGSIRALTVTLRSVSHSYPADMDVLLVGPTGEKTMILSDVGAGNDLIGATLTFSDTATEALTALGPISSGTYLPSDVEPGEGGAPDAFPAPAPAGPYQATLSVFDGHQANGVWSLYAVDDGVGDLGGIGSWTLRITTLSILPQPPIISDLPDQRMDEGGTIGPLAFTVGDFDTPAAALSLSAQCSNPTLIPLERILFGGNGSNRTVTLTPSPGASGTATISVKVSDGALTAEDSFVLEVLPVAATMAILGRDGEGHVVLRLAGSLGRLYAIEASEDLTSWASLGEVRSKTTAELFTDSDPVPHRQRFYRARLLPEEPPL